MPARRSVAPRSGAAAKPRAATRAAAPGHPQARSGIRTTPATWLAAGVVVLLACVAYSNSLSGPFIFDDLYHIVGNPRIHRLWPVSVPLTGSARPILTLSFALDYAFGRLNVRGYHLVNLAIHALAALVLFGVVRRTLAGEKLGARHGRVATGLACVAAGLWAVHPLNTQAVTYVVQRGESLASAFYLMTLYAMIRGATGRHAAAWYGAAVACCALAAGTKPVAMSAPLVVLLYDRVFLSASFRGALRRRRWLYVGLAASWGVTVALALLWPDSAAGFGLKVVTPLEYASGQPAIVLHYLRLAVWPSPLVLDYTWPIPTTMAEVLPPALGLGTIVAAVAWTMRRNPALGFAAAWFVLVLAPSSSIFPINDLAAEHRMYLPLAGLVVLAVVGGYELLGRRAGGRWIGAALAIVLAVVLCGVTLRRNRDYRSEIAIWSDVVAKRPFNARARASLGRTLLQVPDFQRATSELNEALRLDPNYGPTHNNLGVLAIRQGRVDEAIDRYRTALRLNPELAEAHYNLGLALSLRQSYAEAIAVFEEALRRNPGDADTWDALGTAELRSGRTEDAIRSYGTAVRLDPDLVRAHDNLGLVLASAGRREEALRSYAAAIRLAPGVAEYHDHLGTALMALGRLDDAIAEFTSAARLAPDSPQIRNNLGIALARQGRVDEAISSFREAVRLSPGFEMAQRNLQTALAVQSRNAGGSPGSPPGPGR